MLNVGSSGPGQCDLHNVAEDETERERGVDLIPFSRYQIRFISPQQTVQDPASRLSA